MNTLYECEYCGQFFGYDKEGCVAHEEKCINDTNCGMCKHIKEIYHTSDPIDGWDKPKSWEDLKCALTNEKIPTCKKCNKFKYSSTHLKISIHSGWTNSGSSEVEVRARRV